jgi:histidinol-phosphate phosphatase family protein
MPSPSPPGSPSLPDNGHRPAGAVFIDRDGVINRRRPDHVKSWAEFEFLPGVLTALAELRQLAVPVAVITNQSVVGRRLIAQEDLDAIHQQMLEQVRDAGGRIDRIYVCPHHPKAGCACRKPAPELLVRASGEMAVELAASVMIGDAPTDILAARSAGCQPILVAHPYRDRAIDGVPKVRDLREAVALLPSLLKLEVTVC